MNSEVIHLTAANASGPYTIADTALAPRMDNWDNGAVHGISVHRLPNGTFALFYMGALYRSTVFLGVTMIIIQCIAVQ